MKVKPIIEDVLFNGLEDYASAFDVIAATRDYYPDLDRDGRWRLSLEAIKYLIREDLMVPGELREDGFKPWPLTKEEMLRRIEEEWEKLPEDLDQLFFGQVCWLEITPKGEKLGKEIAERVEEHWERKTTRCLEEVLPLGLEEPIPISKLYERTEGFVELGEGPGYYKTPDSQRELLCNFVMERLIREGLAEVGWLLFGKRFWKWWATPEEAIDRARVKIGFAFGLKRKGPFLKSWGFRLTEKGREKALEILRQREVREGGQPS